MTDQPGPAPGRRDAARFSPRTRVTIAGQGLLATAISGWLSEDPGLDVIIQARDISGACDLDDLTGLTGDAGAPRPRAAGPPDGRVLITASDGWGCRGFERIAALCAAS